MSVSAGAGNAPLQGSEFADAPPTILKKSEFWLGERDFAKLIPAFFEGELSIVL
jgi:hypothetical protein